MAVQDFKFVCALLAGVAIAAAQGPAPSLSITGTVLDQSGASVPGATVSLAASDRPVQALRTSVSGGFSFSGLAAGKYAVEAQRDGFKKAKALVQLGPRSRAGLILTLEIAGVRTEISVAGSTTQVSAETSDNRDAAVVSDNLMDKLPAFDQDYVSMMSVFLDAGSTGTGGSSLVVDGMETSSLGVSASAIQEVRINQNPYSAEFARPGKGRIEVITKDAGAEYHGALSFTFRDSNLNARDYFALVRAPEQRRILEGSLLGPFGHSRKTTFLVSGSRQDDNLQAIVYAQTLSGPVQKSTPSPRGLTQLSLRISRQFTSNHAMFWQYNDREYPGQNLGVGGLTLPEAGTTPDHWEREFVVNDKLSLTPRLVNQFQALVGREHQAMTSVTSGPSIVVQGAFTGGGAQTDILRTENHIQLNDMATWSVGKHLLKFGWNVPDWSRRGTDNRNNFGGAFYFSSLQDYAAQRPYAFQVQQGVDHAVYWQKETGLFVQDEFKARPDLSLAIGLRYDWQNYLHDDNNFSPRLAFAYAPKGKATVLRGGAGVFYDRTGAGPLADLVFYNGQRLLSYLIPNPSYPDPYIAIGSLASQSPEIVRLDPTVREPCSIQYSLAVERQIRKKATLSATYRGARGFKLFRSVDVNAPLPPDYEVRPDPGVGIFRQIESAGRQTSDALDVTVQGAVTRFFTCLAQYTLSRTYNNTGGINWFPANQYDLSGEWARADFDQRHKLNMLGSFTVGKGMNLGVALTLASGAPYTLTTGLDPYHTGMANARPPGVSRNGLQGPGYADLDLRWSRDFNLNKSKKEKGPVATVGFDAFNAMNHVNFPAFVGDMSSPFFGKAVSALPARRLQLTVRVKF
jgi:outer membrane receptor protein involved in Fe transport